MSTNHTMFPDSGTDNGNPFAQPRIVTDYNITFLDDRLVSGRNVNVFVPMNIIRQIDAVRNIDIIPDNNPMGCHNVRIKCNPTTRTNNNPGVGLFGQRKSHQPRILIYNSLITNKNPPPSTVNGGKTYVCFPIFPNTTLQRIYRYMLHGNRKIR